MQSRNRDKQSVARSLLADNEESSTTPASCLASAASTISTDPDVTSSTSIWMVPYRRNPFFTGHETPLKLIHDRLTTTKTAALNQAQAISGLGGIGKTQTSVEYAYRNQSEYQYILWVRAAARDTLITDFVAIANLLHLAEKDEQDQMIAVAAVKRWLAEHSGWLLILDNADKLDVIRDSLPSRNNGHILITTRVQAIGSIAHSISVEKMDEEEGALLLLRRARILEPEAPLDRAGEADRIQAQAIVTAMDGLPLALDQAGAYIEETGYALLRYHELYRVHHKQLLQRRSQFPTDHPESVATTWSLSFQKIEQANRASADLLRLCAFIDPDVPVK